MLNTISGDASNVLRYSNLLSNIGSEKTDNVKARAEMERGKDANYLKLLQININFQLMRIFTYGFGNK